MSLIPTTAQEKSKKKKKHSVDAKERNRPGTSEPNYAAVSETVFSMRNNKTTLFIDNRIKEWIGKSLALNWDIRQINQFLCNPRERKRNDRK